MKRKRRPQEAGKNWHHAFWEHAWYTKDKEEKKFVEHDGLVLQLPVAVHSYLHDLIYAPPKPMKEEIIECMKFIDQRDTWDHKDNPYWAMEASMSYFTYRGASMPKHEERCHDIRYNLAKQIGVMAGNHTAFNPVTTNDVI